MQPPPWLRNNNLADGEEIKKPVINTVRKCKEIYRDSRRARKIHAVYFIIEVQNKLRDCRSRFDEIKCVNDD